MRYQSAAGLLLLGLLSLRCDGGGSDADGMGGADGSGGSESSGGTTASGGTAGSGGGPDDCEAASCCLAKETYCQGDEIWRRPLDTDCDQPAEFREACEYGCSVSTLYEFAYCEDAPQGGAGGLGGAGGAP